MKVKCINNGKITASYFTAESDLVNGMIYEVVEDTGPDYRLKGKALSWHKSRFVVVNEWDIATDTLINTKINQSEPINDHVCPSCKNEKVSTMERDQGIPCWSCGGKL